MPRNLQTLKNHEPAIYWRAVDMARDGFGAADIAATIAAELRVANEKRARRGLRPVATSL